jgi:hypothetical protein
VDDDAPDGDSRGVRASIRSAPTVALVLAMDPTPVVVPAPVVCPVMVDGGSWRC